MTKPMTDEQMTMILELQAAEHEGRISPDTAQGVRLLFKENAKLRKVVPLAWQCLDSWEVGTRTALREALRELDEEKK